MSNPPVGQAENLAETHAAATPVQSASNESSNDCAQPSSEPKLCKDCKHYRPAPRQYQELQAQNIFARPVRLEPDWFRDLCTHPSKCSLVSGQSAEDPKMMRAGSCGPEALLWEQQPAPEVVATVTYPTQPYARPEAPLFIEEPSEPPAAWWEFWK